jgi:hypothetical protein
MPREYREINNVSSAETADLCNDAFNEAFKEEFGMTLQEFKKENDQEFFKAVSTIETTDVDLLTLKKAAKQLLDDPNA